MKFCWPQEIDCKAVVMYLLKRVDVFGPKRHSQLQNRLRSKLSFLEKQGPLKSFWSHDSVREESGQIREYWSGRTKGKNRGKELARDPSHLNWKSQNLQT